MAIAQADEWIQEGMQHMRDKNFKEARSSFERAVKLEPKHPVGHAWLAAAYGSLIEVGNMLDKVKYHPLLERSLTKAFEIDQQLPLAHRVNGFKLLHTPEAFGGNVERAIEEFIYCLEHGLSDADLYCGLGIGYVKNKQLEQARASFAKALEQDPTNQRAIEELQKIS